MWTCCFTPGIFLFCHPGNPHSLLEVEFISRVPPSFWLSIYISEAERANFLIPNVRKYPNNTLTYLICWLRRDSRGEVISHRMLKALLHYFLDSSVAVEKSSGSWYFKKKKKRFLVFVLCFPFWKFVESSFCLYFFLKCSEFLMCFSEKFFSCLDFSTTMPIQFGNLCLIPGNCAELLHWWSPPPTPWFSLFSISETLIFGCWAFWTGL